MNSAQAQAKAPRAVLKFGGEVVADADKLAAVLGDVARLVAEGWRFVLCHGGGPQANALSAAMGLETTKVGGRRVTDEATLRVMKATLAGEVNVDVVAAAAGQGLRAVGISGVSGPTVVASRRPAVVVAGGGPDPVDFGLVGRVDQIDTALIECLWEGGFVPVLNTLGIDPELRDPGERARIYNINADTVACAVASALEAEHLFLMTGVPGVLRDKDDPATRIARLDANEARLAIEQGVIVGGMIPKVEEALTQLGAGVGAVHILGAQKGAIEAEAHEGGSRGTVLVPA